MLYSLMVEHINSGKRTKRLTHRAPLADKIEEAQDEGGDES
jgi:hypothetical protein